MLRLSVCAGRHGCCRRKGGPGRERRQHWHGGVLTAASGFVNSVAAGGAAGLALGAVVALRGGLSGRLRLPVPVERRCFRVHHLHTRYRDQPRPPAARAGAPADRACHRRPQGRRAGGDADRLYGAHGAAARQALRHAAGRRFAGAGDLWPRYHREGDAGHDDRPWRGGGARLLSLGGRRRSAVRGLRGIAAASL